MDQGEEICDVPTRVLAIKEEKQTGLVMVKAAIEEISTTPGSDEITEISCGEACWNVDQRDAVETLGISAKENKQITEISKDFLSPRTSAMEARLVEIEERSLVLFNRAVTSDPELNMIRKYSKGSRSLKINRSKTTTLQRSDSLPLCFTNFSVTNLNLPGRASKTDSAQEENIIIGGADSIVRSPVQLDVSSLVAVTPPPSYRSLIKQTLADIPPSYESVTGLSLSAQQELANANRKSNSRNSRSQALQPQSKILIVVVIAIVILTTLILVLAEAFTTM